MDPNEHPNGPKWTQMDTKIPKLTQMDPNGHQNTQMDPNGPKWRPKWTQMDPNGHQMDPNGPKWTQMDPVFDLPGRTFGYILGKVITEDNYIYINICLVFLSII